MIERARIERGRRRGLHRAGPAALLLLLLTAMAPRAQAACPLPSFRSSLQEPRSGDLYLRAGRATCTSLEIEVAVRDVEGLFTLGFDLAYPADLLKFEGHAAGPLLTQNAPRTPPLVLARAAGTGRLQVSITRFAPDGAAAAQGSEVLLILRFSRLAAGTGPIDFGLDPGSGVAERILDDRGEPVTGSFGPGHGGTAVVP
jgi:hypothetical protein